MVWHLKLIVKTLLWPKWGTAIKTLFLYLIISGKFCVIKTLFGFKILFVVSLIFAIKNRNRPSKIHCLNSDWTGDLSLLRYKPDFVTILFVISQFLFDFDEIFTNQGSRWRAIRAKKSPCEGWLRFIVGQKRSSSRLVILKSRPMSPPTYFLHLSFMKMSI